MDLVYRPHPSLVHTQGPSDVTSRQLVSANLFWAKKVYGQEVASATGMAIEEDNPSRGINELSLTN